MTGIHSMTCGYQSATLSRSRNVSLVIQFLISVRITDTSDPGHFSTSLVGPNCPDRLALVPKCPKDSSDLSAKPSCAKCRTVLLQVQKSLSLFLTTVVCSCSVIKKNAVCIDSGVYNRNK